MAGTTVACLHGGFAMAQGVPLAESEFTAAAAERMQNAVGASVAVAVKGPLTLSVGELQANLDRIYAFCKANAQRCSAELDAYVKNAAQIIRARNAPVEKSSIRLAVRANSYLRNAQNAMGDKAAELQSRPLVEGLLVVAVVDSPAAIRMVAQKDMDALKVTTDELFELGRSNLASNLQSMSEVAKPVKPGQIGRVIGDYAPSRLLLVDQWKELAEAQGGKVIVAIPATDALFYSADDSPTGLDALFTFASRAISQVPNPLSNRLLKWTASGWELVK